MTKVDQEPRWWFVWRFVDGAYRVEKFETLEQAELYAAMTDGYVPPSITGYDATITIRQHSEHKTK